LDGTDPLGVIVLHVEDGWVETVAIELIFLAADTVCMFDTVALDISLDSGVDETTDAVCVTSRTTNPLLSLITHPATNVRSKQADRHILETFILL